MTSSDIEALIVAHMPLVERIAKGVAKRMPPWIELDELIAAGNVGLVQAANRYNPELHPNFEYYAYFRVFGSIIEPYRGRNYPRLFVEIPEWWLQGGITDWFGRKDIETGVGSEHQKTVPDALIDPQLNPEEAMIQVQEQGHEVMCITEARERLGEVEGRVLDRNLSGDSMRKIGEEEARSSAWVHYTIHEAKLKLRQQFEIVKGGKKAA